MVTFDSYIGIDYSGAATPTSRLKGLQIYVAEKDAPQIVTSPAVPEGKHWNWTRQEIAAWLVEQAQSDKRFIVGIDHGFSFPHSYFQRYELTCWHQFLDDFVKHWPTHEPDMYVSFVLDNNPKRTGTSDEFRITERWTSSAKSVFDFGGPGKVAHSTHAGIPWLKHLRDEVGDRVHFWPFDGWDMPQDKSVFAEVYPAIFKNRYPKEGRTADQQDAYAIAAWLQETDQRGFLDRYFHPPLTDEERQVAELEGWILGIS